MISSAIKLSVAILLLSGLSEQSLNTGPCSNYTVPVARSFTPESLCLKTWYLISTDDEGLPYHLSGCIKFFHTVFLGTGNVETVETAKNLETNERTVSISSMKFSGTDGTYVYTTEGVPSQDTKILLTDTKTYYVEFSCADEGSEANCYVGIFSSAPIMDTVKLDAIHNYLEAYNIKRSNFRMVEQSPTICGL
ncbi:uncharacterized protein LOC119070905 [Bradysia coprophila]|uniref:uncharacterized protein LOC119070905 n=1 Tax=Bradysia coprophila TaxID=38358 RepID=UPI00187DA1D9|nr:uncharacterized protein LOC119070905 [Bradysia coprophila]